MKEQAIAALVGPVVEQHGLEVDRIEIASAGKRSVLRVYLDGDGPEGRGPSLDEIADATRAVSAALDESDATGNAPYTLEVSSRKGEGTVIRVLLPLRSDTARQEVVADVG